MFLASNELDLRKVIEWSAKSWWLCSGHHLGEGSRCQVPAADSQQDLQVGVNLLQVVEPLVPGKQHFHQMLIMCKLDHRLMKRRREKGENCCEGISFKIPSPMTGYIMHPLLDWLFFKNWSSGFWLSLGNTLTPASTHGCIKMSCAA